MDASIASQIASFSTSRSGFDPTFFGPRAFFCGFAVGGVLDRSESSCMDGFSTESSSSVSGFGRFCEAAGLAFRVVCDVFFGPGLKAVGLLAAGFDAAAFGAVLGAGFALVLDQSDTVSLYSWKTY